MTLADALSQAEQHNLDLEAARLQRAVARAGVRIAGETPNPVVSFGALRDTPHESLFVDQPIDLYPKRKRRIELAQERGNLTELEIATLERSVRHRVRDAYYETAFARGMTHQKEDALALARHLAETAKARFDAGDVPQLEVTQAQLLLDQADADFRTAHAEEKVALSELNALLNVSPDSDWDLGDTLGTFPEVSREFVEGQAVGSNPQLQQIMEQERVERSNQALLEAERLPGVSLEGGADFNSPNEFSVGGRGQISVEVPIFRRNEGELAQSHATQTLLGMELEAVRRNVTGQVDGAYYEFMARKTQVDLYGQSLVPSARKLESLARESYQAGKANLLTVLAAQRDVQDVQRQYLESLLAAQQALANLEETVGKSID